MLAVPIQPAQGSEAIPFAPPTPRVEMSHSRKTRMQVCGRNYKFHYVDRLEPVKTGVQLLFGGAIHEAVAAFLTAVTLGGQVDVVGIFLGAWKKALDEAGRIDFGARWTPERLQATGVSLIEQFRDGWATSGYRVAVDRNGVPIIERELRFDIGGRVEYQVILDAVLLDANGNVLVADMKTPVTASPEGFAHASDQLIGGQVAVDAHLGSLGLPGPVAGRVFIEMIKAVIPSKPNGGEGPRILWGEIAPRADADKIQDFLRETVFVADDILRERFTRRPMDAYNSPCDMCAFRALCYTNDRSGLRTRVSRFHRGSWKATEPSSASQPATSANSRMPTQMGLVGATGSVAF